MRGKRYICTPYFHGEIEARRLQGAGPRSLTTRASTPGILPPDLRFLFTNPAFSVKDVWTDPPRGVDTVTCRGLRPCQEQTGDPSQVHPETHPSGKKQDRGHFIPTWQTQNDGSELLALRAGNAQEDGEEEAVVKKRLVVARERVLRQEQKAGGGERCAAGRARRGSVPGCGGWASRECGD